MYSNSKLDDLEKAFYSDGYKYGIKAVENRMTKTVFYSCIGEMYSAIDSLIESLSDFARRQGYPIACKKGCEWCCHQPVFALDYELDFLSSFVNKHLSLEEQNEIKKKAKEKNLKFKKLGKDNLLNAKHPCSLLKNGICLAYETRPMACRIYLSSNLETCLKFFNTPEDKSNYPALLELPMRSGRMMNEGFKAALKTNGVIAKEFRIEEKLC